MNLRLKYATYLLFVLFLIAAFTVAIVTCYNRSQYTVMVLLLVALYITTFVLGKKLRKAFFILSLLKFLRNNNGSASIANCEGFILARIKHSTTNNETASFSKEIIDQLVNEKLVEQSGESLVLTGN